MKKHLNGVEVGQRFGRLTILNRAQGHYRWLCRCDCGVEAVVYHYGLLKGHTQSCGCKKRDPKPRRQLQLAGQRSGRLVALTSTGDRDKHGNCLWLCQCDCGKLSVVSAALFSGGKSKSCGCGQFDGSRLPDGVAAFNRVYERYRNHALRNVREFALTKAQFHALTQQNCAYCGQHPTRQEHVYSRSYSTGQFFGNGIDRVNNALGYTFENSVPCCEICNRAKRALPLTTFGEWLERVAVRISDPRWEQIAFAGGC